MYKHHIDDMAAAVAERLGLDAEQAKAAREAIGSCWADRIAIIWSVEDVRSCKRGISDEDAIAALEAILGHHDATLGVTWDTIAAACNGDYPDDEEGEDEEEDEQTCDE